MDKAAARSKGTESSFAVILIAYDSLVPRMFIGVLSQFVVTMSVKAGLAKIAGVRFAKLATEFGLVALFVIQDASNVWFWNDGMILR